MTLFLKYMSFLKENSVQEDIRSGAKELSRINVDQFNFGPEYEIVIPYDRFSEGPSGVTKRVTDILEKGLGIKISGGERYVSQETAKSTYRLTYDDSVKSDTTDDFKAVEFVGPIMSFDQLMTLTKKLFEIIEQNGWETSSSSGLHVGISFKNENKNASIDPLKLLVFSGDQFMRNTWPRVRQQLSSGELSSDYVKSNIQTIKAIIKRVVYYSNNITKITSDNIVDLFTEWLDNHSRSTFQRDPEWKNKHFAVNIGRLKDGYVEFRIIGGKDYHKRFDEVEKQIKRFVLTLEQTVSDDTQKDYLKKLYKILNQALDDLEDYDTMYSGVDSHSPLAKVKNSKMNSILERVKPLWVNNPNLKENIYNIIVKFEKNKDSGIQSLLYLLTQKFTNVEYKAMLRTLLVNMIKIYGVTKSDIERVYSKNYFEPGKVPPKPKDEDEESEYWDYAEGMREEHQLSINQIAKILGL